MKKSKQCPKCESLRIGHLERVIDRIGDGNAAPQAAARVEETGFFASDRYFETEAYLCAECGYLETYLRSPTALPYDKLSDFRWVNPGATQEGPYR